jgi:hypothetical protein
MEKSAAAWSLSADAQVMSEGMKIGRVVRIDEEGKVLVAIPGLDDLEMAARATTTVIDTLRAGDPSGKEVLVAFENNDLRLPIVVDTMHSLLDEITKSQEAVFEMEQPDDVLIDGRRIVLDAREEVVLRCGNSSITLTRAGKVLIRGAYLLSRSSGVNRIKGGSVQIN